MDDLDISFWDNYEPFDASVEPVDQIDFFGGYEPAFDFGYVAPVDRWQSENDFFDRTGVYEETWGEKIKSFGGTLFDFGLSAFKAGSKVYGAYNVGRAAVVGRDSLAANYPARRATEPLNYEMQSGQKYLPSGNRVSLGGAPTSGLNTNMILMGGIVLAAAFMMKGR